MNVASALRPTPLAQHVSDAAGARVTELGGRPVSEFRLAGGRRRGAFGEPEARVLQRAVAGALDLGVPLVGRMATSGADVHGGVGSLHAWGRVARQMAEASGTVPMVFAVTGPCVSGPSLLLGLADHVVMTQDAFAYVSGPGAVASTTGVATDHHLLGGSNMHHLRTGVASLVVETAHEADAALSDLLTYVPANCLEEPPVRDAGDPVDRVCEVAKRVVPARSTASYDVRAVVTDVLDEGSFVEVRERWAPNLVTGLGRLGGRSVGVVANQPCQRAGTLDIAASQKGARFVQWCDAFSIPIVTFVDTPGFEPGKDLEWRGMIRHGAQLVAAYAEATVPRLCVVLRKAYGGAYIVMDSKQLGNDLCVAWPTAEVAVMGAAAAVAVLHRRALASIRCLDERGRERERLEGEYADRFLNPSLAAERGYVDAVIDAGDTRRVLTASLSSLATKRETLPRRRHSNVPL